LLTTCRVENTIIAEFLDGVRASAKLEVIVGKLRDSVYELPNSDVKSDLINFIGSQVCMQVLSFPIHKSNL
jgi:hypothetical protein